MEGVTLRGRCRTVEVNIRWIQRREVVTRPWVGQKRGSRQITRSEEVLTRR